MFSLSTSRYGMSFGRFDCSFLFSFGNTFEYVENNIDYVLCLHAQSQHTRPSAARARFTNILHGQKSWSQAFVTHARAMGPWHV